MQNNLSQQEITLSNQIKRVLGDRLGTYELIQNGSIVSEEPAIGFDFKQDIKGISRRIKDDAGIEVIIQSITPSKITKVGFGAVAFNPVRRMILTQYSQTDLTEAITLLASVFTFVGDPAAARKSEISGATTGEYEERAIIDFFSNDNNTIS